MNSFNQLINSVNLEVTFYTLKTSQVKQHFAKNYASDARRCLQGEEALQFQQETLRGAQFANRGGKGQGFDTRNQRQIEDPKTPKKEGREGGKLS